MRKLIDSFFFEQNYQEAYTKVFIKISVYNTFFP